MTSTSDPIVIVGAARTAMGSFQGMFASTTAPELGGVAVKAAVGARRHQGRRCHRGADGLRAAGRRRPGTGAAGFAQRRHSGRGSLHHRQQDVRLRHEDRDAGLRRPARAPARDHRRRRHGEHDECALPAAEDALRRPPRPRPGDGPHVPRRPRGRLRQGPSDGHLCRGHRHPLPVHTASAGRLRGREPEAREGRQRGRLVCQGGGARHRQVAQGHGRDQPGTSSRSPPIRRRSRASSPLSAATAR